MVYNVMTNTMKELPNVRKWFPDIRNEFTDIIKCNKTLLFNLRHYN